MCEPAQFGRSRIASKLAPTGGDEAMSSDFQTVAALVVVAVTMVALLWRAVAKRRRGSCGGGECGAISPDVRKLHAQLKRRGR
jgi:hypothetical protein